jgi:hypothetical protein
MFGYYMAVSRINLLSTDHELIPAGCKHPQCSAGGGGGEVQSMQVEGRLPIGQRQRDVVIHSLTANIGQFNHRNSLVYFFL